MSDPWLSRKPGGEDKRGLVSTIERVGWRFSSQVFIYQRGIPGHLQDVAHGVGAWEAGARVWAGAHPSLQTLWEDGRYIYSRPD